MDNLQLIERATQNNTWVAFLFIGSFLLVAVLKSVFSKQFNDFLGLIYTNKYSKLYYSEGGILNWFSFSLILIQLVSYSVFIQIILSYFGYMDKNSFTSFSRIFLFLTLFISVKYLIEKGVAFLFDSKEFYNRFLFQQVTYKLYLGLFLLFGSFILFYIRQPEDIISYILLGIFILLHLIIYLISYKIFQKELLGKLFYFILYLCTLEIAPYYFTYYWLTKH